MQNAVLQESVNRAVDNFSAQKIYLCLCM